MALTLRMTFLALLAASPVLAGDPSASACGGSLLLADQKVVLVQDNGTFLLQDGRSARLEGIRLGRGGIEFLQRNFVERTPALYGVEPGADRYGRLRVQAVTGDGHWIQAQLLSLGLARVELAPDRPQCARELYDTEKQARAMAAGLWALAANAVRTPFLTRDDTGTFQIVEGRVLSAAIVDGRAFLNFGDDYKTDFTVTISSDDRKTFTAAKVDPRKYAGKLVRVRGIIQFYNGPELEVAAPHQIEIVE